MMSTRTKDPGNRLRESRPLPKALMAEKLHAKDIPRGRQKSTHSPFTPVIKGAATPHFGINGVIRPPVNGDHEVSRSANGIVAVEGYDFPSPSSDSPRRKVVPDDGVPPVIEESRSMIDDGVWTGSREASLCCESTSLAGPSNIRTRNVPSLRRSPRAASTASVLDYNDVTVDDSVEYEEDVFRQLTCGVLPAYSPSSPPPVRFELMLPPGGYHCPECGDAFVIEMSLFQHLQRRSLHVTYECEPCRKVLVFYNRCNLLSHVRVHRERHQPVDLSKVTVSTIAWELLLCGMQSRGPKPSCSGSSMLIEDRMETWRTAIRCLECMQLFPGTASLEEHFSGIPDTVSFAPTPFPQCPRCGLTCPSRCSLLAHVRIHSKSEPFVCPECGVKVSDSWDTFRSHLMAVCVHYSRRLGHRCPRCGQVFVGRDLIFRHCLAVHGESYVKCQACPMAFKSGATFEAHCQTVHGGGTDAAASLTIHKCPLCDIVFQSTNVMHTHLAEHLKSSHRPTEFVFRCPECSILLESKLALISHLRSTHPTRVIVDTSVGEAFPEQWGKENEARNVTLPRGKQRTPRSHSEACLLLCHRCNRGFYTRRALAGHRRRCRGSSSAWRSVAATTPVPSHSLPSEVPESEHRGSDPVTVSGVVDADADATSRQSPNESTTNEQQTCHLCPERNLSSSSVLIKHLLSKHEIPAAEVDGEQSTTIGDRRDDVAPMVDAAGQDEAVVADDIPPKPEPMSSPPEAEDNVDHAVEPFQCAKCGLVTQDQSNFLAHIVTHKEDRDTFQCTLCGTCFLVAPSLWLHLTVVHKIKDARRFWASEGGGAPETGSDTGPTQQATDAAAAAATGAGNWECAVCYRTFDAEMVLKTHLRTHGMAFIRTKRTTTTANRLVDANTLAVP